MMPAPTGKGGDQRRHIHVRSLHAVKSALSAVTIVVSINQLISHRLYASRIRLIMSLQPWCPGSKLELAV